MWRSMTGTTWVCAAVLMLVLAGGASAAAAGLPDGRGYELVSPAVKHGTDVAADSHRTRAASDGGAISFVSLGGFGDVRGTGQATEYIAERSSAPNPGTSGWQTHAITPKQDPLPFFAVFQQAFEPLWQGELSPDLSKGVFRAWSPVTNQDPNIGNVENLYRRTDLRNAGAGSYQLLTPCLACSTPFTPFDVAALPELAGSSTDFSHVAFESALPLTADAGPGTHLYEWANGTLRLADILPDSACGTPPCHATSSAAGPGAGFVPRIVSADGSRIVFSDTSTRNLYERIDGSQTVQLNTSEKTIPDSPQRAVYQTASVDGTRVFFTSAEQLTDADTNGVIDLYMWDATATAGHHLTLVSVDSTPTQDANDVRGVIGASDDGRYVYFVADGQRVAGKPVTGSSGFYLWHQGATPAVRYIGEMALPGDIAADLLKLEGLQGGTRARVTPDGRHMAFVSHSGVGLLSQHNGVDYDQSQCPNSSFGLGCGEFYLYSADTDSLVCMSCNPNGAPATADADTNVRFGTLVTSSHTTHSLSDDGQRFFFHTAEALVPGDANGKQDVYEYDAVAGGVHLISTGRDPGDSFFMDASANGSDVFFLTREQLVGWDTDQSYDLYDARIGGGFPGPAVPVAPCAGDGCRGALSTAAAGGSVGSALSGGDGNVHATSRPARARKPRVLRCRKGLVRKRVNGKVRCVKKRAAKHTVPKRAAHKAQHAIVVGRAR